MGYGITWNNKGCIVSHPAKGDIRVEMKNGCPMVKGGGSLQLTEDLENFSLLGWQERGRGTNSFASQSRESSKLVRQLCRSHLCRSKQGDKGAGFKRTGTQVSSFQEGGRAPIQPWHLPTSWETTQFLVTKSSEPPHISGPGSHRKRKTYEIDCTQRRHRPTPTLRAMGLASAHKMLC